MDIKIGQDIELIDMAQTIRYNVFTVEQNIPPHLDLDGLDEVSTHALVVKQNTPVATARLTVNSEGRAVLARVAVMPEFRGAGIATRLVKALMNHAKNVDAKTVEIHAHQHLRAYYQNLGFDFVKEVEVAGEHQLIEMQWTVTDNS